MRSARPSATRWQPRALSNSSPLNEHMEHPEGDCRLPTRFGQMPVAHDPLVTVRGKLVGMATASSARAPLRKTSVSGSAKVPSRLSHSN